jgi:hypothetical protein
MVHASLLSPAGYAWFPAFAGKRMRAGVAVAITLVFIVYSTVLARLWAPEGLFLLCDILLHYVTPLIFVLWWLIAGTDGKTRWRDISWWMIYPIAYLACALIRSPFAGEVPPTRSSTCTAVRGKRGVNRNATCACPVRRRFSV